MPLFVSGSRRFYMNAIREACERLMDAAQARFGAIVMSDGEEHVIVRRADIELLLATWEEKH